jgi:pyrroloquinoline quinone biosynthesis protein B
VRVRVLGSAAGGGFPQWNCNCANCRGIRTGAIRAKPRTQCSIAVTGSGAQWILLNASPDLRTQISSFPELFPKNDTRGSAIASVMLTDAELDHTAGLLSLRETQPLTLHCTRRVFEWLFEANPVFGALIEAARFRWHPVENQQAIACDDAGLEIEAIFVHGKVPTYVKKQVDDPSGGTVAYKIRDGKSSVVYVPAIKSIKDATFDLLRETDCILFDGSFWWDDEMARRGVGTRTSLAMGHLPIDGPDGSLARLSSLRAHKVYTHINNTNPILDEDSPERAALARAGWEVAEDGMEIIL